MATSGGRAPEALLPEEDEEADGEEREGANPAGWDWVYDDETVRQEQEEASARAETNRRHWESTAKNAASIRQHLTRLLDDRSPHEVALEGMMQPAASRGALGSRARSIGVISEGNVDHQRTCITVADKMYHSQERWVGNAARRAVHADEEEQKKQRICAALAASDARVVAQQQELVDAQRRRSFNNAQRRSEQQKTLKEMRREKDRIWEAYYNKSRAAEAAERELERSRSPSLERNSPTRGNSAPALLGPGEDDIWRSTVRSHGKYASQMDQWKQFVLENERRTESQWRNILQGASKAELIGVLPSDKFRKTIKVLCAHHDFGKAITAMAKEGTETAERFQGGQQQKAAKEREPAPRRNDTFSPGSSMMSNSFSSTWGTKREQCRNHYQSLDLQNTARREFLDARLSDARERIATHQRDVVDHFKETGRLTKERSDTAAMRRAAADVASDESLVLKMKAFAQRHAEDTARSTEMRRRRAEIKDQAIANARETVDSSGKSKAEAGMAALQKVETAAMERVAIREAERLQRIERDNFPEMVKEAQRRRAQAVQATVAKAKKEIAEKNARSARALEKQRSTVMDKERSLRKERAQLGSSLSVSAGLTLPLLSEPGPMSPLRPLPRRQNSGVDSAAAAEDSEESEAEGEVEFVKELCDRSGEWLQELRRHKRILPC